MRLKKNVKISGISSETLLGMTVANDIYKEQNMKLVITSVRDGKHKVGSKHYCGLAFDIRDRDFRHLPVVHSHIVEELRDRLGSEFDVVPEDTHIHIEFDPK